MNKYKIVSVVLAISLLGALARLVAVTSAMKDVPVVDRTAVVLDNIHQRKSVRSFTGRKVNRQQMDTLVRAAMAAPTGRDMRPWKFIVLDDRAVMDSLAVRLPYAKMLSQVSAALVVCGDLGITDSLGNPSGNWTFDCSAATENALLAAEAMGLGAVWTGVYPYPDRLEAVKSVLALPETIIPLNVIPVGYPKGEMQPKVKYDADNVHFNGW